MAFDESKHFYPPFDDDTRSEVSETALSFSAAGLTSYSVEDLSGLGTGFGKGRISSAKPSLFLMGPRRSGKTSIERVIFRGMEAHQTLFQVSATREIRLTTVSASRRSPKTKSLSGGSVPHFSGNPLLSLQIFDFPGAFDLTQDSFPMATALGGAKTKGSGGDSPVGDASSIHRSLVDDSLGVVPPPTTYSLASGMDHMGSTSSSRPIKGHSAAKYRHKSSGGTGVGLHSDLRRVSSGSGGLSAMHTSMASTTSSTAATSGGSEALVGGGSSMAAATGSGDFFESKWWCLWQHCSALVFVLDIQEEDLSTTEALRHTARCVLSMLHAFYQHFRTNVLASASFKSAKASMAARSLSAAKASLRSRGSLSGTGKSGLRQRENALLGEAVMERLKQRLPSVVLLMNKIDANTSLEQSEDLRFKKKRDVEFQLRELIRDELLNDSLYNACLNEEIVDSVLRVSYYLTSIYDYSIFEQMSKIISVMNRRCATLMESPPLLTACIGHLKGGVATAYDEVYLSDTCRLLTALPFELIRSAMVYSYLERALTSLVSKSGSRIEKAMVFDVKYRLYVAMDSGGGGVLATTGADISKQQRLAQAQMAAVFKSFDALVALSSDMIHVTTTLTSIYGPIAEKHADAAKESTDDMFSDCEIALIAGDPSRTQEMDTAAGGSVLPTAENRLLLRPITSSLALICLMSANVSSDTRGLVEHNLHRFVTAVRQMIRKALEHSSRDYYSDATLFST